MPEPIVDFRVGLTDPASFPVEELALAAAEAVSSVADDFVFYPGPLGHAGLRQVLAARESKREGIEVDPDHLALTNGSMQAVALVAQALMQAPGDIIITEELTYSGTISAYKELGARLVGIPVDEDGMRVDVLAEKLEQLAKQGTPPRFIYTLPTYQNPTGAIMPVERRHALLKIARQFDILIVEDNCYGDVHFEGEVPPSLYALAEKGDVVYICSLSKIFAAGLRMGYLLAQPEQLERITAKRLDLGNSVLAASICAAFLEKRLWEHVERHNAALDEKRKALLSSLDEHLADLCRWTAPRGGLFLWLQLPSDIDLDLLDELSAERGVGYAPGSAFHIEGDRVPAIRLAFGYPAAAEIRRGVGILTGCIRDACATTLRQASL